MAAATLTPAQCRAARALLGISEERLAAKAGVGGGAVRDFEQEAGSDETDAVRRIASTLSDLGVIFIPGDARHGEGVRLARPQPAIVVKPAGIRNGVMAFVVGYQGRRIKVRLSEEALVDLATKYGLPASNTDKQALAVFQAERYRILRWIAANANRTQQDGTLIVKSSDVSG
jgi:transcriptional regulator with XRE-family HTH domain